jgi:SPP1 family predicted phage head-tail adaptor
MDPGRFRDPVVIEGPTRTPDGAGGFTETWTSGEQLWAEIAPLRGDEQIQAQQTTAAITHRVRMWAVEGVKSTRNRVRRLEDDAVMEIVAPPIYDRQKLTMELLVHEVET